MTTLEDDLRRHLTEMQARLWPLLEMAKRDGVPALAAARLRAAAFEIEAALDPEGAARRRASEDAVERENMEAIRRRESERGAWGIDEA
ncbi:MAG: hypothetical protein IRZ13_02135 [Acetobacteraceae bacterium]|nr:hypothetical protein [Acetobacteraceae bacterium]